MNRSRLLPLAVVGLILATSPALAVPLPPGSTVDTKGAAFTAGTLLTNQDFTFSSPRLAGDVRVAVFKEKGGHLDFLYQVTSTKGTLGALSAGNFGGFKTDVDWANNAAAIPPFVLGTVASVSATRPASGTPVTFSFVNGGLKAGQTSKVFFIKTDATAFDEFGSVTASLKGGAGSFGINNVPEPAVVPEPASLALALGLGLPLGAGFALRRWKAKRPVC
jgi:hypothetical protein